MTANYGIIDGTQRTDKPLFEDAPTAWATIGSPGPLQTAMPWNANGITVSMGTANRCYFERVTQGEAAICTKIALQVGISSGNIAVAVYANRGSGRSAVPTTRIASSGSVACPASGYAEVPLGSSVPCAIGSWFAFSCDNATATFGIVHTGADISAPLRQAFAGLHLLSTSTFPCPPTFGTFLTEAERRYWLMGV